MRILYVCTDPGIPVDGNKGAAVHVRELCRALSGLGHDVRLAAARIDGMGANDLPVLAEPLVLEPVARRVAARLRARGDDAAPRRGALVALAASRAVASRGDAGDAWQPDAVYERHSLFGGGGLDLARRLCVPHLLEVNAPLAEEQARHRRLAWPRTARRMERHVLRGTGAVLAVSEPLARWAEAQGAAPSRVHTVPNGVDVGRFAMAEALRHRTRAELGLADGQVVGFAGSLKAWHGTASLLRAFARIAAGAPRARLLVVGDGPERAALEALAAGLGIAGRTVFTGAVPHARVPEHLAALDVAVAPYDAPDGGGAGFYFSPLKLFEYMAAGRAVVAADLEPIRAVVAHERTGWLYPAGDVVALAHALRRALANPGRAEAMGLAARQHVRAHHTWRHNAALAAGLASCLARTPAESAA